MVKAVAVDSLPAARGHSTPSKGGKRKDRQNCKTDRKPSTDRKIVVRGDADTDDGDREP